MALEVLVLRDRVILGSVAPIMLKVRKFSSCKVSSNVEGIFHLVLHPTSFLVG